MASNPSKLVCVEQGQPIADTAPNKEEAHDETHANHADAEESDNKAEPDLGAKLLEHEVCCGDMWRVRPFSARWNRVAQEARN